MKGRNRPHSHRTDRFIVFARLRQCARPSRPNTWFRTHITAAPKQHLNRLIRFCRVTGLPNTSVWSAMRPFAKLHWIIVSLCVLAERPCCHLPACVRDKLPGSCRPLLHVIMARALVVSLPMMSQFPTCRSSIPAPAPASGYLTCLEAPLRGMRLLACVAEAAVVFVFVDRCNSSTNYQMNLFY